MSGEPGTASAAIGALRKPGSASGWPRTPAAFASNISRVSDLQSRGMPRPPAWARWLDLIAALLLVLAGVAALVGGIRFRLAFVRVSLTSPLRIVAVAAAIAAVRHLLVPRVPIYRDLPTRLAEWRRAAVIDDVEARASTRLRTSVAVALIGAFTVLAALMTYPLVTRIGDGVSDPGDPLLNTWALQWVSHQLITSPTHLFDGNIFAPEHNTLAYSETLIAPAILTAPLSWLGAGGVLVHNIVFLAGFIASGAGVAFLVWDLTGRLSAAVLAGVAFAFLPFRFDHFPQLQLQQAQWIPLAVWACHRVLWAGRIRDGVWLGAALAAQLMSCMYYGIFLSLYLVLFGACLFAWRIRQWRRWLPALAVGAVTAMVLFAPAANAYLDARTVVGERGRQENIGFSATLGNYLAAPDANWIYGSTAKRFGGELRNLFPGAVVVVLAALALWPPLSAVRIAYAIGLVFAVDLTLGFNGIGYPLMYDIVSPIRALRIPALAVILVGFSLAVLAGFGASRIRSSVVVTLLTVAVLAESVSLPMPLTAIPTEAPAVYADMLRDNTGSPPATIVELPIDYTRSVHYEDQIYMYYSTFHWQTLVNGYSGFFPPAYLELAAVMRTFPDARSLELLRARKVRYVVIHGERMGGEHYRQLLAAADACACGLTLVEKRPWQAAEVSIYRMAP
jgi:hypothetical protein